MPIRDRLLRSPFSSRNSPAPAQLRKGIVGKLKGQYPHPDGYTFHAGTVGKVEEVIGDTVKVSMRFPDSPSITKVFPIELFDWKV